MSIEEEIFDKYIIDKEQLIQYGFEPEANKLIYSTSILEDRFQIIIEYNGKIRGKVIEVEYQDEYINYRLNTLGEFRSCMKDTFVKILTDVRDHCAEKHPFKCEQTKRVNQFIDTKYDARPEFLWDKFPNYCIYRADKKWFGVLVNIPRNKVDKHTDSKEEVEIINVKVNKNEIDDLLNKKGYYEAFHMNKRNWVSIILDETLSDLEVQSRICDSYENIQ